MKSTITFFALIVLINFAADASAEGLMYSKQEQNAPAPQVAAASSNVTPVSHSTSNDPQFSPYASFMQSPYGAPQGPNGAVQQQYMVQNGALYQAVGGPAMANPATQSALDPYRASEVSPYAHYSPYMEVVGQGSNYTLGLGDVVTVIVREQPDFSGRFVIDPEGNVQFPFLGDIPAVGKNKEELKAEITQRMAKFVRYPEVAVMISEYNSKSVYVFGYVNRPGKYAMKGDKITVKEAIVAAGLLRPDAASKRVFVIRPSHLTKDGKPSTKKVNTKELLEKGNSAEDFILAPGDTIVVSQKYFDRFINGYSRVVGPVFQTAAVYNLAFGAPENGFFGGSEND